VSGFDSFLQAHGRWPGKIRVEILQKWLVIFPRFGSVFKLPTETAGEQ
jgi:hypothetical protein